MSDLTIEEIKIARFMGIDACKSVFSEDSTFVVRSPLHYRRLYELSKGRDTKADGNEGLATTPNGGTAEFTSFLASCWTVLDGSEPTREEWNIFKGNEQNVLAIVTTPRLVSEFLETALHINRSRADRRFPFLSMEHHRVCYKEQNADSTNLIDTVPFAKSERFRREKEYRFVLKYAWLHDIDSLVFCAGIEYMRKRDDGCLSNFANPDMSRENKEELLLTLMTATSGYRDFSGMDSFQLVANIDDLLQK